MQAGLTIRPARGAQDMAAVRGLMAEYLDWHHTRYAAHRDLIERHFDHAGFQAEMDGLPGAYAPPSGELLIAWQGTGALGCVAVRGIGVGIAEMRRLFVTGAARGKGIGRALAMRIMGVARDLGFREMRLDTGPLQTEAIALYQELGFAPSDPHYPLPEALAGVMAFMACDLTRTPCPPLD